MSSGPSAPLPKAAQLTEPSFVVDWDTHLHLNPEDSVTAVHLVGDNLHIYTKLNYDYVVVASSGELLYFNGLAAPNESVKGAPVMLGDRLVFVVGHTLQIYNTRGHLQKTIDLDANITTPPTATKREIIVGLSEDTGRMAAVDINRDYSYIIWRVAVGGSIDGAAAVDGSSIYFGSEDGSVYACATDREPIWPGTRSRFTTKGPILSNIKADAGGVYAASGEGVLYCLDHDSGKLKWRFFGDSALTTSPDVTSTMVYQFVRGTGLAAIEKTQKADLDTPDHKVLDDSSVHTAKWVCPNGLRFLSEDAQFVYVQSTSHSILALDKTTGEKAFETHRKDLVAFSTNFKSSAIYASTSDGLLLMIRPTPVSGSYGRIAFEERPLSILPGPLVLLSANHAR